MKPSLIYSIIFHLALILCFTIAIPFSWRPAPEEIAISLEMLPISNKSNVPPKKLESNLKKSNIDKLVPNSKPIEEKQDKKEESPKEKYVEEKEKVKQPEKVEKLKDTKKEEKKKEESDKKTKEDKQKKTKKQKEDLDSLLKSLEESTTTKEKKKKGPLNNNKDLDDLEMELNDKSDSTNFDNAEPLSMTERDAIRSQIEKRWNVPAGAKDANNLLVVLRIKVMPDGAIAEVTLENSSQITTTFHKVAADSAIRAVHAASPLQNLKPENYNSWKDIEFTFDPSHILN